MGDFGLVFSYLADIAKPHELFMDSIKDAGKSLNVWGNVKFWCGLWTVTRTWMVWRMVEKDKRASRRGVSVVLGVVRP